MTEKVLTTQQVLGVPPMGPCCETKYQKNPRVRKIRVRNSGAGNGSPETH